MGLGNENELCTMMRNSSGAARAAKDTVNAATASSPKEKIRFFIALPFNAPVGAQ
jgi:hypothetical protein